MSPIHGLVTTMQLTLLETPTTPPRGMPTPFQAQVNRKATVLTCQESLASSTIEEVKYSSSVVTLIKVLTSPPLSARSSPHVNVN